jgi:hypothetical protein
LFVTTSESQQPASVIFCGSRAHGIVVLPMTHFPQPHPQNRAARIQFGSTIPVVVKLDDGRRAKAKLQSVSETGGMLRLARALEQGNLVEVAIQTESGAVQGMAEMLNPSRAVADGVLQPFRFIALEDDAHRTLRSVLDTRAEPDFAGLRSSQWIPPRR